MLDKISKPSDIEKYKSNESCQLSIRPFPTLALNIKAVEYKTEKTSLVPFMLQKNQFNSPEEAMQFLFNHCRKYHGNTKRNLIKQYSNFVDVLDLGKGGYCSMASMDIKEFNKCYTRTKKLIFNNF